MKGLTIVYAVYFLFVLAGFYGWVNNIITICGFDFGGNITGLIVVRIIGVVVAPLGAILGYF